MMFMVKFPLTSKEQACFKILNSAGDELSLAADDSCGAMQHFARLDMCLYPAATPSTAVNHVYGPTPEEFLQALADLLGYEIRKK